MEKETFGKLVNSFIPVTTTLKEELDKEVLMIEKQEERSKQIVDEYEKEKVKEKEGENDVEKEVE